MIGYMDNFCSIPDKDTRIINKPATKSLDISVCACVSIYMDIILRTPVYQCEDASTHRPMDVHETSVKFWIAFIVSIAARLSPGGCRCTNAHTCVSTHIYVYSLQANANLRDILGLYIWNR